MGFEYFLIELPLRKQRRKFWNQTSYQTTVVSLVRFVCLNHQHENQKSVCNLPSVPKHTVDLIKCVTSVCFMVNTYKSTIGLVKILDIIPHFFSKNLRTLCFESALKLSSVEDYTRNNNLQTSNHPDKSMQLQIPCSISSCASHKQSIHIYNTEVCVLHLGE